MQQGRGTRATEVFILACLLALCAEKARASSRYGGDGAVEVSVRRLLRSESNGYDTELDDGWVNETVTLRGESTALVMIDVWDDAADATLSENEWKRLLPLLTLARSNGWLVVHAPSEGAQWAPVAGVLPGEILVTGENGTTDRCDPFITRHATRNVTHVVMAGYDTNMCMLDKPCGAVQMTRALLAAGNTTEVLLARDATRPQSTWNRDEWDCVDASVTALEAAAWLRGAVVRSLLVADVARAFGTPANDPIMVNASTPLLLPAPSSASAFRAAATVPAAAIDAGTAALVVVSCSSDWRNDGFRARVAANRALFLEPLLAAARAAHMRVIHAPNGHQMDGACAPASGEVVVNSTAAFDGALGALGVDTLLYAGYAANDDVLWGDGGMARYYARRRYFGERVPAYYWVEEATVGRETASTLAAGEWAKRNALAYRQPQVTPTGNVLRLAALAAAFNASRAAPPPAPAAARGALPAAERAVLEEIYERCGGSSWAYTPHTDAVGGGKPWNVRSGEDPCAAGWFGVGCNAAGTAVTKLFPNTRHSGNPLTNCELPESIGALRSLQHLYTSNDATPSSLVGGIPASLGNLSATLKCVYFSHNNLTKPFPRSLEGLTQLQVFLARRNSIGGAVLDFSRMRQLRNVWIDGNELTGTLESLANLTQLTFVQAQGNALSGRIPPRLCALTCEAGGGASSFTCPLPRDGCCDMAACGHPPAPPPSPPAVSFGECIPQ